MSQYDVIRVVIAEDIPETRNLLERLLEMEGYAVVGKAADGLEAVEITRKVRPDVVLMDVAMPGIDGIEATRRIQACCPTPVVILSVYTEPDFVRRASEAGAGAYLGKPPRSDELERAITVALARFSEMVALSQANDRLQAEVKARTEAEESLRRRLEVERLVSGVSAAFVQASSDALDQEIARTLGKIGELVDADRCFFFSLSNNGPDLERDHEWCAGGVRSRIEAMEESSVQVLAWWTAKLAESEPICLPDVSQLSTDEQRCLNPPPGSPAQSFVAVPLVLAGSRGGFLGFDALEVRHTWGTAEILLLTMVGEILGRALERKEAEAKLAEADKLAFVGQMASAIAHELRNPLSIIAANSELLLKRADNAGLSAESAQRIVTATRRASSALDKLLGAIEQQEPEAGLDGN